MSVYIISKPLLKDGTKTVIFIFIIYFLYSDEQSKMESLKMNHFHIKIKKILKVKAIKHFRG